MVSLSQLNQFNALGSRVLFQGRVEQVRFQQIVVADVDFAVPDEAVKFAYRTCKVEPLENIVRMEAVAVQLRNKISAGISVVADLQG